VKRPQVNLFEKRNEQVTRLLRQGLEVVKLLGTAEETAVINLPVFTCPPGYLDQRLLTAARHPLQNPPGYGIHSLQPEVPKARVIMRVLFKPGMQPLECVLQGRSRRSHDHPPRAK